MIIFVSFCTPRYAEPMRAVLASARVHGAHAVRGWTKAELSTTSFYNETASILDAARGAGYWAWKPFVILEALKGAAEGDTVVYSDAGRPGTPHLVDRPLTVLADWVAKERGGLLPGVYIPQWGPNRRWTKGECFRVMGCEDDSIRDHPQVQATFSVWRRGERAMAFVDEWLAWCRRPEAIADERVDPAVPDAPDFVDHRHDQSVLTNLVLRRGLGCFGDPYAIAVGGDRRNASDKWIGHLIDRIEGRTWAVRARIAREDRRLADAASPPFGPAAPARRATRLLRSWRDAAANYPVSHLDARW